MFKIDKLSTCWIATDRNDNSNFSIVGVAQEIDDKYKLRYFINEDFADELEPLDKCERYISNNVEEEMEKDINKILGRNV